MPGAANPSQHGLLAVNHEYTNEELMFPGLEPAGRQGRDVRRHDAGARRHRDGRARRRGDRGAAATNGKWQVVAEFEIRAAASTPTTPMEITGPAAGHARLQTTADPSGRRVLGMINNCAGGVTPWGTWLTCEENFHGYFNGKLAGRPSRGAQSQALRRAHRMVCVGQIPRPLQRHQGTERAEPLRLGGRDRSVRSERRRRRSAPRSAAPSTKAPPASSSQDGRYVVYTGDDERFDYVYRFVTTARVDRANPRANRDILDDGALSVARYNADGTLDWLPLVHGQGPLTAGQRLREPGRCADRDAPRRRPRSARPRWTGRRTSRPIR